MILKRILKKIIWYVRILLTNLKIKRKYRIGKSYIMLDYTSKLPDYQNSFPFYDRFLPHFAKYLSLNSIVIDIGANVGDTVVSMINSNLNLKYICIEADKHFFSYLEKNISALLKQFPNLQVKLIQEFVGKNLNNVKLEGKFGTKHAKLGGKITSKTLDNILKELFNDYKQISLIKTDVDGFDYDVIRSGIKSISHNPFLYFECDYSNKYQLNEYKKLFFELKQKGYNRFTFFDNYGHYLCDTDQLNLINNLLDYAATKKLYLKNNKTINYYDVLAYNNNKSKLVLQAIKKYNFKK